MRVRLRLHQNTVAQWTEQHVALVRELAAVRRLQHQQTNLHTQRYVYQVRNSIYFCLIILFSHQETILPSGKNIFISFVGMAANRNGID